MPNGYLSPGQDIGSQSEDNFTAATNVVGATPSNGGRLKIGNILIGPTALASVGNNTTGVAAQFFVTDIFVPFNRVITKIGVLQGGTATTDNILVAIWDSFGKLVGSSAVAGSVLSGANTFQELALVLNSAGAAVTSLKLLGPQRYFIGVQTSGGTVGDIQTVAAATYIDVLSALVAPSPNTFGTIPATITPPTTWTANQAPVVYVL